MIAVVSTPNPCVVLRIFGFGELTKGARCLSHFGEICFLTSQIWKAGRGQLPVRCGFVAHPKTSGWRTVENIMNQEGKTNGYTNDYT